MRNNTSADLLSEFADSTVDTLILTYVNPNATGATGTISYSVTYSV
jgi:hypothetical protein